jgi:hypothetical protein
MSTGSEKHDEGATQRERDADGKVADTGPVLDVESSSIDDERAAAGATDQSKRAAPPEVELPPD